MADVKSGNAIQSPSVEKGNAILPWDLIDDLHCPYCGSRFERVLAIDETYAGLTQGVGVLRCESYEYPVVSGIAVLRQMSPRFRRRGMKPLNAWRVADALLWLLESEFAINVPNLAQNSV